MNKPDLTRLDIFCDNRSCQDFEGRGIRMMCVEVKTGLFGDQQTVIYQCGKCHKKKSAEWKESLMSEGGKLIIKNAH